MMIRALLRKQLRELGAAFLRSSKTGKARSRASAVGYALLFAVLVVCLLYTSPSPRDVEESRMPSSA